MEDGVYYIPCDRPGCNCTVGAQRYENGELAEEEWYPDIEITEDGHTYCKECKDLKDDFRPLEDLMVGELDEYICID